VRRCRRSAGSRADSQPEVSQAQRCNGTADKVIRGRSRRAGPRRNLLRTDDGAWRWIDY
jgi:hypothetical protein